MNTNHLDLGGITISWLNGGEFALDGGTMFGAVPKVLWSRKYPSDNENYIKMLAAPLLVRTRQHTILIDTGLGNKLTEKQQAIYRVSRHWGVLEDLADHGLTPADIDTVILTHCDFDHAGGVMHHDQNGQPAVTFPNARHLINEMEWEDFNHPSIRSAHTYFPQNLAGLEAAGLLQLINGAYKAAPGVTVKHTGGHTRGHQIVEIAGDAGCAAHLGDLMPTHAHANPLWIMAYDDFPLAVIADKERRLKQYRDRGCWFTFYHDDFIKFGRMDETGKIVRKNGSHPAPNPN